jgi:hypothetical protein
MARSVTAFGIASRSTALLHRNSSNNFIASRGAWVCCAIWCAFGSLQSYTACAPFPADFGCKADRSTLSGSVFLIGGEIGAPERSRTLSDIEIAEAWGAAGTLAYPFGPFFKLAIRTLQRREEVAGTRWSEIAEDMVRWTLPGIENGEW